MTLAASRRPIALAVLILVCGLVYRAAVDPAFEAATISIIDSDTRPHGRIVRVTLPDLGPLRGAPPIVTGELVNRSAGRQHVRVMLGSVVRAEVDMTPDGRGRFVLQLSPGAVRATAEDARSQYRMDLVGDNDAWHVASLRASNARADWGVFGAVVPAEVAAAAPAPWMAWTLLALLAVLSVVSGGAVETAPLRPVYFVVVAGATLLLAAVWLLPIATDWRLLVTPLTYWSAVVLVLAPAVLGAQWGTAARFWQRHPVTCERGAMFLGLVALAVAQPVFDVLAGSPEFFIARNTTATVAVAAVALVVLGVPLALLAMERIVRSVTARGATLFTFTVVAILLALMIHPWLRRGEIAEPVPMAAAAAAAGILLAWFASRAGVVRTLLAALAPAAVVVPLVFFVSPEVAQSFTSSSSNVRTPPLAHTPPIVLVVFDEFPVHSLLDASGGIDAVRFPSFGALARDSTWFRETTAVSSQTVWAVPAIASGRYPVLPNAVPTLRYYPENLFTLLADRYRMHVFGRFLQLCPEAACERDAGGPRDGPLSLLSDLGIVWLHIVSPQPVTERLPPVVGDWAGFARAGRWRNVDGQRVRDDRRTQFDRFLAAISAEPARLYFLHSLLPHMAFEYVPSGRGYDGPDYQQREERGQGLFERVDAAYADAAHQRHLLQVGFVDTLIGRLVARLRSLGIYDETLLIVTADHGASYRERMPRRTARTENLADIIRVPLFIKRPGQRTGAVVDGVAESVDILPTIADVLGGRLPFDVDGQSLYADPASRRTARTFISRTLTQSSRRDVTDWRPSSEISMARRIARFGVGPYDLLYAVPGTGSLIGQPVEAYARRAGTLRVRLIDAEAFQDVDVESETLPLHVGGRVYGQVSQPIAVAVNGRIAATTMPFVQRSATVFATMIPERFVRAGSNDIATFLVEGTGERISLVATAPPE